MKHPIPYHREGGPHHISSQRKVVQAPCKCRRCCTLAEEWSLEVSCHSGGAHPTLKHWRSQAPWQRRKSGMGSSFRPGRCVTHSAFWQILSNPMFYSTLCCRGLLSSAYTHWEGSLSCPFFLYDLLLEGMTQALTTRHFEGGEQNSARTWHCWVGRQWDRWWRYNGAWRPQLHCTHV